jgi:hypothetical protein
MEDKICDSACPDMRVLHGKFCFVLFCVLEFELRASHLLGRCSTT